MTIDNKVFEGPKVSIVATKGSTKKKKVTVRDQERTKAPDVKRDRTKDIEDELTSRKLRRKLR